MAWLPEDQRDTRYYLWEPKFLCRMRYSDSMTIGQLRSRGIYTSGDPVEDKRMMNSQTNFYLSINDMVEYFRQGIVVSVLDRADTATIYEHISNHINAFREEINKAFTMDHIPLDDLVLLDQFASTVYEHAKHEFTKDAAHSLIARRMDALAGFTPSNILGEEKRAAVPATTPEGEEEDDGYQKRDSLADYFTGLIRSQRRAF